MTIYFDIVIIVNFSINLLFLLTINLIFHDATKVIRIIASSLLASLFLFVFLFDYIIFLAVKIFGGLFLVGIGLGFERLIAKSSLFYLLQFSLTGLVDSFSVSGPHLLLAIIILIILFFILRIQKESIFKKALKYNISASFNGHIIESEGFLDTGNFASLDHLPIVFFDIKYFSSKFTPFKVISINSINGTCDAISYKPDEFYIFKKNKKIRKDVLVVFQPLDMVECLLNYNLMW